MGTPLSVLEKQALQLSPEERSRLADRLLSSLIDEEAIEEAWASEVERRVTDIEAGRRELVSADESIARARSRIK